MNATASDRPLPARSAKSVLVISLRYFGDVLLTTPLIRAARRGFPEARIDVLLISGAEGILEGNPDVAGVATVGERPTLAQHRALADRLLWRRYDVAVVAETGDRPHIYGYFAAPWRAGLLPAEPSKRWWKRPLLQRAVIAPVAQPRIESYRRLAQAMELPFEAALVAPTANLTADDWSPRLGFDAVAQRYAVLNLAPRFRYKRWNADGWRSLIAWLHRRGLRIAVTGGAGEAERRYGQEILADVSVPVIDLTGRLRFAETADLLRGAALYVGPDTATSHLAAACGTPSVVLFGPTDPRLWGPLPAMGLAEPYAKVEPMQRRANVMLLQESSLSCVPCQEEGCERHRESYSACLDKMSASKVIEAAQALTGL